MEWNVNVHREVNSLEVLAAISRALSIEWNLAPQ